jgi:hypothetical protein
MKNQIILVATELMLLCISSCNLSETNNTHIYSVIEDITEHNFKTRPQAEDLLEYINIDEGLWGSTRLRYTTVSEIDYNQRKELILSPENKYTGNSYLRKKEVQSFKNEVAHILENSTDSIAQTQSSIFLPIIRELDQLSLMRGAKRELIVFSDLKENDLWFSFYNPSDLKSLENDMEKIGMLFLSKIPKDVRIKDVSLTIIYEPLDANDNQEFRLMVDLYKHIFKKLDVPISFSANL